jgi:transcriptional regulator with XRE-family HTH domain
MLMAERKRRARVVSEALRGLALAMQREGEKVRAARRRRRWTQAELGRRTRLHQTTISKVERGAGATLSVAAWQRVADVLDLPLDLKLGRDGLEETRDAGHLPMQELVLRLGRGAGYARRFELTTRPADPTAWADVGLIAHAQRRLVLIECCNVIGDIGASTRSSDRKQAEAQALAVALGGEDPYAVHVCWVIRDTRRNRALLARYPELFATRFPGSSRGWVEALTAGTRPPVERGLVWCNVGATRLFEWRRPASTVSPPRA